MERDMNSLTEERKDCENQLKKIQGEVQLLKKELETKSNDNGKRDMKSANFEHEMELRDRNIEKLNDILE